MISQATFWHNSASFYQIFQEIDFLKATKKQYQRSHFILEDIKAALELLELSADEELLLEAQINLTQLQQELETIEIQQLLSNPHDQKGAFLTITARVGGVDAKYWAYMLLGMYSKWGESHSYKILLVEESYGAFSWD